MTMKVFDLFETEGDPMEQAIFAMTLIEMIKAKHDHEEAKKDSNDLEELLKAFGNMTFEEIMRKEQGQEQEQGEDDEG